MIDVVVDADDVFPGKIADEIGLREEENYE
jgi:hypothetical protein